MIEHDMEFVRQIARIVTVLHEGTVICEGTVEKCRPTTGERSIWAPESGACVTGC